MRRGAECRSVTPSSPADEPSELGNPWPTGPVKSLRRTFEITKTVASARVYATAMGAYKLSINGQPVGDEILAPGWTDFRQRVVYQAYDVTANLKSGKNAIAALLAPVGIPRRCCGFSRRIIMEALRPQCERN